MRRFFSRPEEFSFKDLLAVLFTAGFFYVCYRAITEPQALELVKTIAYLIAIILGGYFGQEMVSVYTQRNRQSRRDEYEDNIKKQPPI